MRLLLSQNCINSTFVPHIDHGMQISDFFSIEEEESVMVKRSGMALEWSTWIGLKTCCSNKISWQL